MTVTSSDDWYQRARTRQEREHQEIAAAMTEARAALDAAGARHPAARPHRYPDGGTMADDLNRRLAAEADENAQQLADYAGGIAHDQDRQMLLAIAITLKQCAAALYRVSPPVEGNDDG